jgi:hypothetical protein
MLSLYDFRQTTTIRAALMDLLHAACGFEHFTSVLFGCYHWNSILSFFEHKRRSLKLSAYRHIVPRLKNAWFLDTVATLQFPLLLVYCVFESVEHNTSNLFLFLLNLVLFKCSIFTILMPCNPRFSYLNSILPVTVGLFGFM